MQLVFLATEFDLGSRRVLMPCRRLHTRAHVHTALFATGVKRRYQPRVSWPAFWQMLERVVEPGRGTLPVNETTPESTFLGAVCGRAYVPRDPRRWAWTGWKVLGISPVGTRVSAWRLSRRRRGGLRGLVRGCHRLHSVRIVCMCTVHIQYGTNS